MSDKQNQKIKIEKMENKEETQQNNSKETDQWCKKLGDLEAIFEKIRKKKCSLFTFKKLGGQPEAIENARNQLTKAGKDAVPANLFLLLAKLAENRKDSLSKLTKFIHSTLFPASSAEFTGPDHLNKTTKECPISLLTTRATILKVSKRKSFGAKKSFSKNTSESEDKACGWRWQMHAEELRKLPPEILSKVKRQRSELLTRSLKLKAYSAAIKCIKENPNNVKKILSALDALQKTEVRADQLKKGAKKRKLKDANSKKNKIIKNAQTASDKEIQSIPRTPKKKATTPKRQNSAKSKISSLRKSKNKASVKIIRDYFSCVPGVKQNLIQKFPTDVWYRPWQPPENVALPPKITQCAPESFSEKKNFRPEIKALTQSLKRLKKQQKTRPKPNALKSATKIKSIYFSENRRPSYFGTFRRKSAKICGRRFAARDEALFNYSCDSEDDWGIEPEDAEEIGSEDECCNAEEGELGLQGKLRRDGLLQDDFLEPENDKENKAQKKSAKDGGVSSAKRGEDLVAEVSFEGCFGGRPSGKLSRFSAVEMFAEKGKANDLAEAVYGVGFDELMSGLAEGSVSALRAERFFREREEKRQNQLKAKMAKTKEDKKPGGPGVLESKEEKLRKIRMLVDSLDLKIGETVPDKGRAGKSLIDNVICLE